MAQCKAAKLFLCNYMPQAAVLM